VGLLNSMYASSNRQIEGTAAGGRCLIARGGRDSP
jgi:hypothetical protein